MFGRKKKILSQIDTLIGSNTVITGDIQFTGGLRIDGRVCGNITASEGESHAMLVLSECGLVEGEIKVPHMIINGTVKGPVHADHDLELQANARIIGDIYYETVKIHQGAAVEGKLVRQQENSQPEKMITLTAPIAEQKMPKEDTE